mmetsp:Transcript_63922/g.76856  ORF Transcript_63922/g.76856 Transcript_63922/m.76856 type:complete len:366 (+) Transcript_63922:85-1182(+)
MAAVLCTLPCRACASACSGCNSACRGCNCACDDMCNNCDSSFCIYGVTAVVLNLPPIIMSLIALPLAFDASDITSCKGLMWTSGNLVVCTAHIVAACYLNKKVSGRTPDPELANTRTAAGRACRVLCYDVYMAGYLGVLIFGLVWLVMGTSWLAVGEVECDDGEGGGSGMSSRMGTSIGFGWTFVMVGSTVLCLSFCCATCDRREDSAWNVASNAPSAPTTNTPAAAQNNAPYQQSAYPTNDSEMENEIPIAVAVPIPSPSERKASQYAPVSTSKSTLPSKSNAYANASAPPSEPISQKNATSKSPVSAIGSRMGTMLGLSNETKGKIKDNTTSASVYMNSTAKTAQKGASTVSKFVGSKWKSNK